MYVKNAAGVFTTKTLEATTMRQRAETLRTPYTEPLIGPIKAGLGPIGAMAT